MLGLVASYPVFIERYIIGLNPHRLAHTPDTADTSFTSRADLMISGHTHGGQDMTCKA